MTESVSTIGLIAGGKQFPVLVARGVKAKGHRLVVAGFTGHTNMDVVPLADVFKELKLGKLNQLIGFLKSEKVDKVIMAGTIEKPKVMDIRHLDMRAIKLVLGRKDKGDSALLGIIAREFEKEGMPVVPAHEYMPDLLSPEGVMTRREPDEREWSDLKFGWGIAKELGRMDVGQCVVVREGIVVAVEALEGTDETLRRGARYGGSGCVVVKVFKPGQQKEVDLPSLGLDTLRLMAEGKATCLGVEAGKSLFFDREAAVEFADKAGITVVGLTPGSFPETS
ncbi:UDP-2,3-diacylglucosamine diphosphatase LpxI [Pseudodesulfovibrio thermohalotolerans]|uniref:LpxI family protein n=1 Tax=Pseudodesulfovibrio thermohalotolerans TaxID=2880651 RepID=UPI002441716B|nr:UDP-2,3-diacylglucosamine diphosphatase LpxI [Pseudodesulfovibrio thermohalotolerans]WFS61057.1 UDP-2,3-diacylglucosamine diphosphatase LpxI [Pseudodesulfovibrio thermohalotolerans]